jgi:hypothetical protein
MLAHFGKVRLTASSPAQLTQSLLAAWFGRMRRGMK